MLSKIFRSNARVVLPSTQRAALKLLTLDPDIGEVLKQRGYSTRIWGEICKSDDPSSNPDIPTLKKRAKPSGSKRYNPTRIIPYTQFSHSHNATTSTLLLAISRDPLLYTSNRYRYATSHVQVGTKRDPEECVVLLALDVHFLSLHPEPVTLCIPVWERHLGPVVLQVFRTHEVSVRFDWSEVVPRCEMHAVWYFSCQRVACKVLERE
jgi:hypothetical protein